MAQRDQGMRMLINDEDDDDEDDEDDDGDDDDDENDENEDDDPLPAGNLLSGGLGGAWACQGGGGLTGKFQGFQWSCSLLIPC